MTPKELVSAIIELKSIHQTIGAIGVKWRRCKPGTKRFLDYEKRYDTLMAQSYKISDEINHQLHLGLIK